MQTLYAASVSGNLVSLSKLDVFKFTFKFGHGCFSLFKNNSIIGFETLVDGLYKLKLDVEFSESLLTIYHNIGTKCNMLNENFAYL